MEEIGLSRWFRLGPLAFSPPKKSGDLKPPMEVVCNIKLNLVSRHPKTRHKNLDTKRKDNLMFGWTTFLHPSNRSIWHPKFYSCSPFRKIWNVSSQSITPTDHGIAIIIEIFTIVYITYICLSCELISWVFSKLLKKSCKNTPPSFLIDAPLPQYIHHCLSSLPTTFHRINLDAQMHGLDKLHLESQFQSHSCRVSSCNAWVVCWLVIIGI